MLVFISGVTSLSLEIDPEEFRNLDNDAVIEVLTDMCNDEDLDPNEEDLYIVAEEIIQALKEDDEETTGSN